MQRTLLDRRNMDRDGKKWPSKNFTQFRHERQKYAKDNEQKTGKI